LREWKWFQHNLCLKTKSIFQRNFSTAARKWKFFSRESMLWAREYKITIWRNYNDALIDATRSQVGNVSAQLKSGLDKVFFSFFLLPPPSLSQSRAITSLQKFSIQNSFSRLSKNWEKARQSKWRCSSSLLVFLLILWLNWNFMLARCANRQNEKSVEFPSG
jgi:hypothetical protein